MFFLLCCQVFKLLQSGNCFYYLSDVLTCVSFLLQVSTIIPLFFLLYLDSFTTTNSYFSSLIFLFIILHHKLAGLSFTFNSNIFFSLFSHYSYSQKLAPLHLFLKFSYLLSYAFPFNLYMSFFTASFISHPPHASSCMGEVACMWEGSSRPR